MLYNLCCVSALFSTAALPLLPKLAYVLLLYKWTVRLTKQIPKCAFYWLLCVKKKRKKISNYLLMYIFNFAIIPDLCKSKYSCCHLFVVYYYDFCPYLVAIKDTLIFERLWSCMCGTSSPLFPCGSLSQVVWLKGSSCHWFLLIKFKDLLMRIWSSTPLLSAIIHNPKNSTQSHLSSHVRLRLSCFSFDQSQ